jgi:CSLREA domain-containing protein
MKRTTPAQKLRVRPGLSWTVALPGRTTLKFLVLLTGIAAIVSVLAAKRPAHASATIIVNTATDDSTSGDGLCSLRKAINNANAKGDTTGGDCNPGSGNDTIILGHSDHL